MVQKVNSSHKLEKISPKKLANLLTKNNIQEASSLRRYDYFKNLLHEIVGGKSSLKITLENIFKNLDDAFLTNPKDSNILLQTILQVLAQHIADPRLFLESISFVKTSKNGEKGFFLKLENKDILLNRFFTEEFMPQGLFIDNNAADLKLNPKTIQLIIHKVECLKLFNNNEIKEITDLQGGDIVIFVRTKRQGWKKNELSGRAISFFNSLANPHAIFGHNRSTHAGIIVQGKEIAGPEKPIKEENILISHVVKDGFTKQPLSEYFDHTGGEKRTLFVFRPKNKEMAKSLIHHATLDDNYELKWTFSAGLSAIIDKSKGSKIVKKQLSSNTVCSKFVAQCMKNSLNECTKKENVEIDLPINSNITPKKLEHWLLSHIDIFDPCIYFGDRKTVKTLGFKPTKSQIIESKVKDLKKRMNENKYKNYFVYTLAEIKYQIAEKELRIERLKFLNNTFLNDDEEVMKDLLIEKHINLIHNEIEVLKNELKLSLLINEGLLSSINGISKNEEINKISEQFKNTKVTTEKLRNEFEGFKKAIQSIGLFANKNTEEILTPDFNEHKRNFVIALNLYKLDSIRNKIDDLKSLESKHFFITLINHLTDALDENIIDASINYYSEILNRLIVLESEINIKLFEEIS